jgi:hypothetical protein
MQRSTFHPFLCQLFENLCRISSSIDLYAELIRDASDQVEHPSKSFLLKSFAVLSDRCQSTTSLLQSNERTFGHPGEYAVIMNKFARFEFYCRVNVHCDFDDLTAKIWNLETLSTTKQSADNDWTRISTFDPFVASDGALFDSSPRSVQRISDTIL